MFAAILALAALAGVLYLVYRVVARYRAATGSPWERLLASAKDSATILWHYAVMAGGLVVTGASTAADYLNMPEVDKFIHDFLTPQRAGVALMAIALVTIIARMRTLPGG